MAFGRKRSSREQEEAAAHLSLASEMASLRSVMEHYPAGSSLCFGAPSRCPECGDYGVVMSVNYARGVSENTCRACRRNWTITDRALRAYHRETTDQESTLHPPVLGAHEELLLTPDQASAVPASEPEHREQPVLADFRVAGLATAPPKEPARATPDPDPDPGPDPDPDPQELQRLRTSAAPDHEPPATSTAATSTPATSTPVTSTPATSTAATSVTDEPVEPAALDAPPERTERTERTEQTRPVDLADLPPPPDSPPVPAAVVGESGPEPPNEQAAPPAVTVDLTEPLPTLRVLVVDDNPFDFAMVEELLEPFIASGELVLEHRATRRQGEEAARTFPFDVVLLDLDLHDTRGLTTVLEWNDRAGEPLPLIALIDEPDADLTQETTAAGIHAVIQKAHLEKLTSQGDAGQRRLHRLLRTAVASAEEDRPDPRWSRSRRNARATRSAPLAPNPSQVGPNRAR